MPESVELVLRGGAATLFLLLSVFLLRDGGDRTLARLGALFCVLTAYWALKMTPLTEWAGMMALPLYAVAHGKAAAFWLFTRALFEDGFRMRWPEWAVLIGMMALGGVWGLLSDLGLPAHAAQMPHQAAQIALALAAAWTAWRGRGGDLVEPRRRARIAFVLLSSLFMVGITGSYIAPGAPPALALELNVVRMFVMALGMALLVGGLRSEAMFSPPQTAPAPSPPRESVVMSTDPAEARLLSRLQTLMAVERVYRREGLTIGALAAEAGAPEHVLRRLINGRLGYRNFNAYLNGWRLSEAKAALRDPAQRDVPISTIALDAGFSSLGPFNRAFKAAEGVTPSAYREGADGAASHDPPLADSGIRLAEAEIRRA